MLSEKIQENQIDHIFVNRGWIRIIYKLRSYQEANVAINHVLVIATIHIKIMQNKPRKQNK